MKMEPLEHIDENTDITNYPKHFNKIVDRLNEICKRLFPLSQPEHENKGYENQELNMKEVREMLHKNQERRKGE